jgi:hypothetical protein
VGLPGVFGAPFALCRDVGLFHFWTWLHKDGGRRNQASAARRDQWWFARPG